MREDSIYNLLHTDHETVAGLFKQMESAEDAATRERLLGRLKEELLVHSEAEATVFYSPLKESEASRGVILEAEEEHRVVTRVLGELERLSPENERWAARLTVLKELVDHHVEEEEGQIFKKARAVFDRAQERELGTAFLQQKKLVLAEMRKA
jgi:hemerythrin superfamily protein